ncbi:hypothetical protein SAMN05421759_105179 [Roseivivax lentus]|uniref:Uncharacterized protein n=1 Tax=Roseivivax lentus TaxID=633194 RepID=A0A1N7MTB3_9RHOB|nr:hypothetical protein [Roseivivax lentus]SIS89384.1 hypothetical protein SAMN05421759_105179 [Roseivivax lentus]
MRDMSLSAFRVVFNAVSLAGLAVLALGSPGSAGSETLPWPDDAVKRPYIFTQQHNVDGRPDAESRIQKIRLDWPLQVQLPGNPAVWTFVEDQSVLVEPRGRTMVYSPNRIDGTESIFVFDFALAADAKDGDAGVITLATEELPASLAPVMPNGVFVVKFHVIDPD